MKIIYETADDSFLLKKIRQAEHEIALTAPGISMPIAEELIQASNNKQ